MFWYQVRPAPLLLLFFLILFLAIRRTLFFHMNFKVILSYLFKKKLYWNSHGNFYIPWLFIFGESCHFYDISIPIQDMVCLIFVQISFHSFGQKRVYSSRHMTMCLSSKFVLKYARVFNTVFFFLIKYIFHFHSCMLIAVVGKSYNI